jgi:hypothetical protein
MIGAPDMTKDEFCTRFVARMVAKAGFDKFADGFSVAEYAAESAPTYFEEEHQRVEGPEECADSDMSYWGD